MRGSESVKRGGGLTVFGRVPVLLAGIALAAPLSGLIIYPQVTPAGPEAQTSPTATPDLSRLAEPVLPANPSQADLGKLSYWKYCMSCHGDRGQGLTSEFRTLYPPEEANCWVSGCHGRSPYENGFTLPGNVPPIIGEEVLSRFPTASMLLTFLQKAMPYQAPGSLSDEEYNQITAYLARENGLASGEAVADSGGSEQDRQSSSAGREEGRTVPVRWDSVAGWLAAIVFTLGVLVLLRRRLDPPRSG